MSITAKTKRPAGISADRAHLNVRTLCQVFGRVKFSASTAPAPARHHPAHTSRSTSRSCTRSTRKRQRPFPIHQPCARHVPRHIADEAHQLQQLTRTPGTIAQNASRRRPLIDHLAALDLDLRRMIQSGACPSMALFITSCDRRTRTARSPIPAPRPRRTDAYPPRQHNRFGSSTVHRRQARHRIVHAVRIGLRGKPEVRRAVDHIDRQSLPPPDSTDRSDRMLTASPANPSGRAMCTISTW
jgi:hypothetical protein